MYLLPAKRQAPFQTDDSWPLRQLTDTISDTRVRLNKATEHLDKLKSVVNQSQPAKRKVQHGSKAAERALEQARLSARRLSLRHVQKAEITSTESLSEKEQELFHEDGPPYSLCAFCHAAFTEWLCRSTGRYGVATRPSSIHGRGP